MERGLPFDVSNNVAVYTTDLARKICDKAGIPLGKAEEAKEKVHTPLCGLTTQHNTTQHESTQHTTTVMYKQWHLLPQEFAVFILFHENHCTLSILCYANQFFGSPTEAAAAPCVLLHLDPSVNTSKKSKTCRKHTLVSSRRFRNLTLTLTQLTDLEKSYRNTLRQRRLRR